MIKLYPEITPGSYWICKNRQCFGIGPADIIAKVLSVNDDNVHVIRKTECGFTDLTPATFKIDSFLTVYMRLED